MAYSWAKVYIEVLDDHKMGLLSDNLWRRVIEMILLAKKLDKDGWLPGLMEMSWVLRMPAENLEADLTELSKSGIVELKDGNWFMPNFTKRQDAEPVIERVRNFRKRTVTAARNDNVTESYIDKTRLDTDKDKDIGADAPVSEPEKPKKPGRKTSGKPKTPKLPHERDALFDAIAEVCCVDPATAGASIGNVKAALLKAKPPYSADEVKAFGLWHNSDEFRRKKGPPSLWNLKEKIGIVRNGKGAGNATNQKRNRDYSPADDEAAAAINKARRDGTGI